MNLSGRRFSSALSLGLLLLPFIAPAAEAKRPNIILIMTDDVGTGWFPFHADRLKVTDLEPEISAIYTEKRTNLGPVDLAKHIEAAKHSMPFLDKLAKESITFDNCFATSALCAPSRAGLLTGTFQQKWGAYWNRDVDDHGIPADRVVLAEPLKAAGYATAMIGKWHVAKKDPAIIKKVWTEDMGESLPIPAGNKGRRAELPNFLKNSGYQSSSFPGQHPLDRGFDYYYGFNSHDSKYFEANDLWEDRKRVPQRPPGEFLTDSLSDKATKFIESAMDQKKPFFLYYAPLTLHGQIVPPPAKYTAQFDTGNRYTNEYAGHLRALDEGIRQLFTAIEAKGELDNTLFLFTSDNGCTLYNVPPYNAPNRGGKGTGWLGGLNVPLVVWGKELKTKGISQEIISLADLMPTILEYAGLAVPEGISGKSFIPYLAGKAEQGPRDSLNSVSIQSSRWSYFYDGKGENNTRDGDLAPLYAWHFDGRHLLMRITPTRAGLYESLPEGLPAQVMLYDTRVDRQQRHNLAPQNWEKVEKMDETLRAWLAELQEPVSTQKEDYKLLLEEVKSPKG
jgi:uncharacterized sulfatase